jgi:pyruvate dehydrogenase E2 component (dihydrolipoamide acetyltransferase)
MSDSVQMPALGESVTEGTVTRWLKQIGDRVEVDEPLLEVSTDKVDTEIPSPVAGVLEQILVSEDETVEIGAQLALIGDGSGSADAPAADESGSASEASPQAEAAPAPQAEAPQAPQAEAPQAPPAEAPQASESQPPEPEGAPAQTEAPATPAASAGEDSGGADGTTVTMPALGESVTEGTVTRWLKQQGDTVEVDEPLLEVSTDKVDTEIPSPVAGVVRKILVGEDETVEVGAALAVVGGSEAPAPAEAPPTEQPAQESAPAQASAPASDAGPAPAAAQPPAPQPQGAQAAPAPQAPAAQAPAPQAPAAQPEARPSSEPAPAPSGSNGSSDGGAGYVTPLVRRMATEQGIDLSTVKGTGVGGRIRKQDVVDAAKAKAKPAPEPTAPPAEAPAAASPGAAAKPAAVSALRGTTEKMSRLRKVIAKRMVESLQTSAQLTTVVEVDVTRIARLRDRAKNDFLAREGVKLSFMPFFALAAVEALKQHPKLNASIENDSVVYHAEENLGFAVDVERGLTVPVIHGAGDLNIAGLARKITDLADRTRNNKITPDDLGGGTFTLTNTGSRGALFDTPIIFLPQTAILGTGVVVKRPVVVESDGSESIAIRSIVYLALSYDHRLVDGADATRFLMTIKERLEEGAFEADLGL